MTEYYCVCMRLDSRVKLLKLTLPVGEGEKNLPYRVSIEADA